MTETPEGHAQCRGLERKQARVTDSSVYGQGQGPGLARLMLRVTELLGRLLWVSVAL